MLFVRSAAESASRACPLLCAGLCGLRGSGAVLVASSVMIGVSIEGSLGTGVDVIETWCPKRGQPTEGKNWP